MSMTFRLIEQEKPHHAVSQLCRVLGGSRAGCSAWQGRSPSARAVADQQLTNQLRSIQARSRATDGALVAMPSSGWTMTCRWVASGSLGRGERPGWSVATGAAATA